MPVERSRSLLLYAALAVLLAGCAAAPPADRGTPHGVIGVRTEHFDARYWIARAPQVQAPLLDTTAIQAQNERLQRLDASIRDLEALPDRFDAAEIRSLITSLSSRPRNALFDESGSEVTARQIDALEDNLNLDALTANRATRYAMVVRRADLRTFPTGLRVFSQRGDTDIDRFQESALFPGDPVVLLHESRDGQWWFVLSARYAAWVERQHVAEGEAHDIFQHLRKSPHLIVTGATARTVYTPEQPGVSELQLDMGVRAPLLSGWPPDKPVNGQHPHSAYVIELPTRAQDGSLRFAAALLPRTADVSPDYLPLTRANLLRQSFKFLGERYGWGHSYNGRDCSGFVSEIYRSFGVQLPRNTRDQALSPALNRVELGPQDDREARIAALRSLQIGDLVFIPGHVMMVIGHDRGEPYVIHDTTGVSFRDADGELRRAPLNGVSVTPLTPLLLGDGRPMTDGVYSIVRIRN